MQPRQMLPALTDQHMQRGSGADAGMWTSADARKRRSRPGVAVTQDALSIPKRPQASFKRRCNHMGNVLIWAQHCLFSAVMFAQMAPSCISSLAIAARLCLSAALPCNATPNNVCRIIQATRTRAGCGHERKLI